MAAGLRTQILAAPILLTALSFTVLGATTFWITRTLVVGAEDRNLAALLDRAEGRLQGEADDLARKALDLSDNLDLGVYVEGEDPLRRVVNELLPWMVRWELDFVDVIDATGHEVVTLGEGEDPISGFVRRPPVEPEEEHLYRLGVSGIHFAAPVVRSDGTVLLVGVAPIKSRLSGRVVGALLLGRFLDDRLLAKMQEAFRAQLALYARDGRRIASSSPRFDPSCGTCHPSEALASGDLFHLRFLPGGAAAGPSLAPPEERLGMRLVDLGGEPFGLLVLKRDLRPSAAAVRRGMALLAGLALLFSGGGLGALLLAVHRITRPVRRLAEATRRRAEGDLEGEVRPEGAREIWEVAEAFNAMTARLRASLGAQAELVAEMEAKVRERTRALEEAVERLLTVNELGRRLPRASDPASILRAAVPLVAQAVGARAGFALLGGDGAWRLEGIYGKLRPRSLDVAFPPDVPLPALLEPGEGVLLDGTADTPLLDPVSGMPVRALLAAPVGDAEEGEPRGILLLYDPHGRERFTQRDLDVVLPFARELAGAVALARLHQERHRAALGTIEALVNAIEAKDPYTKGHTLRVTQLASAIGRQMGLADERLQVLHQAAALHDIGKIGIRYDLLNKPAGLTDLEYDLVKQHPLIGARILEPLVFLKDVAEVVLQHHERPDGTGYPLGISGERLLMESRVLAVADAYDAMTSRRSYRAGLSREEALEEMRRQAGRQFDPDAVEALEKTVISY
ncbi:MAG: hypothetical protein Kow0092_33570 [Deferrisomatales bacterium]